MSEQINFLTDKLIILYYPRFAGGKFLGNCLALSKHAVFQHVPFSIVDLDIINANDFSKLDFYDLANTAYNLISGHDWPSLDNFISNTYTVSDAIQSEMNSFGQNLTQIKQLCLLSKSSDIHSYYDFKKYIAMQSLPDHQSQMNNWGTYEYGCFQFFGVWRHEYERLTCEQIRSLKFNDIVRQASHSNKNFFLVAHGYEELKAKLKVWPRSTIIQLYNFKNFQNLAGRLKSGLNDDEIPEDFKNLSDGTIHNDIINFDVDGNFNNKSKFLITLSQLYGRLRYTDFDSEIMEDFYNAYARLHGIT
jgi:hypothetical protein